MKVKAHVKMTALLIAICLQVHAGLHAEVRVTLSIKNGSIETVLNEIHKQTGYLYALQDQWKQGAKKITISVTNVPLEDALDMAFKDQPFTYTIISKTIVLKEKENAHQKPLNEAIQPYIDVHGRVLDENKQPVAGVTVTVRGTKRTVSTDENGEFTLKTTDRDAILEFTSVNMENFELKVNGEAELTVSLRSKTKELGEVSVEVNTGYQKIPKERATGSFDFIDKGTINQQVGSNILNRLDGVASGVIFPKQNLQGAPTFMVRGLSTINGPNSPLIVVDNFPYDGDINNINPNDVESVTILKDAAAASIWGARAGNGAVVITTKKGKFNQPLKLELNSNVIITQKPSLSNLNIISSGDYLDVEKQLFDNGFYDGYLTDTYNYPAVSPAVEILNSERNGDISLSDAEAQINAFKKYDVRQQYLKYMYQKAVTQQYSLNIHGGGNNISYYLSAGYDKSADQLNAPSNRLTIRSDNIYKLIICVLLI